MKHWKIILAAVLLLAAGLLLLSARKGADLSAVRENPERGKYSAASPEQRRAVESRTRQLLATWEERGPAALAALLPDKTDDEKAGIAVYLEKSATNGKPEPANVWIDASDRQSPYWVAECRFADGRELRFFYSALHGRLQLVNIY